MRKQSLFDHDVEAVLRGEVPEGRADLAAMVSAVEEFRHAFLESAPQPSPALAAQLNGDAVNGAAAGEGSFLQKGLLSPAHRPKLSKWRPGMILNGLAGLGVGAKLGLGTAAAVVSLAGAGVAGILPGEAQSVVDGVVSKLSPFDRNGAGAADDSDDAERGADPEQTVTDSPENQPDTAVREAETEDRARDQADQHAGTGTSGNDAEDSEWDGGSADQDGGVGGSDREDGPVEDDSSDSDEDGGSGEEVGLVEDDAEQDGPDVSEDQSGDPETSAEDAER